MPLAIKHTSHFIFEIMLIRHTRVCHRSISVKLLLYALFLAIDEFTLILRGSVNSEEHRESERGEMRRKPEDRE